MKSYYYLDSIEDSYDVLFYRIKSDLSYDELLDYLNKYAINFLKQNEINIEDFLSYEIDEHIDDCLEIPFNGIHYFFSLRTCTDKNILETKLTKKININTLEMKLENVI